ncbi:hypothetical protein SPAB_02815 [Salmonella enterica subsp. enterica serovar Paratyphi B str. SPB7]|uniref:Uncharacterized protein n=1 Tax=Salmonella paratyphi B (strain ATCC BAA-1250 / SPB7) TaxID=1016998 RepID=A0A6C6Z430_SALPB|nr:hypothetical protein SPAB_02815 [Salmonella enterica subsp. enterica serovar Paratyphi B str. SPB7]
MLLLRLKGPHLQLVSFYVALFLSLCSPTQIILDSLSRTILIYIRRVK